MIKRFSLLAPIACAFALSLVTPAAAAGPVNMPIAFTLSSARCSQIPSGTTLTGQGTAQFSMTPSGNLHSVINGTATDTQGHFWRFNYTQNMRPIGGTAVEVTDHFNLVGSGSPIKLHSHFVADFSSSDIESADLLALKQIHGDPIGCDPI